jgi:hypothetical protein
MGLVSSEISVLAVLTSRIAGSVTSLGTVGIFSGTHM